LLQSTEATTVPNNSKSFHIMSNFPPVTLLLLPPPHHQFCNHKDRDSPMQNVLSPNNSKSQANQPL
jgi:hypothetical protein